MNANGERVYKLTGSTQYDDLNGSNPSFGKIFDGLTVYPSPYIVLTEKQYTKHFWGHINMMELPNNRRWH